MGEYSRGITERWKHTRLNGGKGYCLICGEKGKLSKNHVPPKAATIFRDINQYHAMELSGANVNERLNKRLKGVSSTSGSFFTTICKDCNSLLGQFDGELGALCTTARDEIEHYFRTASAVSTELSFQCDVKSVMRSVVGHMISASTAQECSHPPSDHPLWDPLKRFVLEGADPSSTHDFYCWFYPYRQTLSAKSVGFLNEGHIAVVTVLSFYPFAFLLVEKGQGIHPGHAHKISLGSDIIELNLAAGGFPYARFPFHELKGYQVLALVDACCVVSVPKLNQ